ncbi:MULTISPECIES: type II secretion system ATPase GspE [Methylomonas]|uniref:Type II secretion system protein E n=2 Tax=Methylomonas TaxID=416 RepID=A0A126T8J0_9GAMM|nr:MULTISPECIES: type II secretion system ATPase GspE [Methylomonas]AMK78403.1 type II secretion system protein GspE [Methylomonas denitrificans]OAI04108.1 type II secretion system protein GspE [Methylomonas methanica]TCV87567.1 type II secretion system protein E (GspE) [Methylomonas methanica]
MEIAEKSEKYAAFLSLLKSKGKLSDNDLGKVRRMQKSALDDSLPQLLIKLGLCSDSDIAVSFAEASGITRVSPEHYPPQSPLPDSVSQRFLKQYHAVGLAADEQIQVAVMDPEDDYVTQALQLATGKPIKLQIGQLSEIDAALELQYGEGKSQMDKLLDNLNAEEEGSEDLEHLKDLASEAPIIKMVNFILQKAVESRASDVHIEPFEQSLKVRLRIDGVLQDIDSPPVASTAAVLSRIKIMAKLNIAERRLPQDGRIKLQMIGKELDLRVSTIPTLHGESVVIRLLDKENAVLDFETLGFVGKQAERFMEVLAQPHGILLITGPTGSGKSTSLYAALKTLNTSERKIITVEDPVEYQLEGINQIQAKPQIGLTFASALRSIVRQDPDVIMIGEMRDLETAKIAVQSALTGHLVLSTLHTNDAAAGVTRLQDMGLEEYLLSSTINGILAQRLVRRLCPHCKQAHPASDTLIEEIKLRQWQPTGQILLHKPVGCPTCNGIGYKGRLAIIEFLTMTDTIRKQIMKHEEAFVIQQTAIQEGMQTMYEDGVGKALQGITTLEEVLRVTTEA